MSDDLHDFQNRTWLRPLVRPMAGDWRKWSGGNIADPIRDEIGNVVMDENSAPIFADGNPTAR